MLQMLNIAQVPQLVAISASTDHAFVSVRQHGPFRATVSPALFALLLRGYSLLFIASWWVVSK